MAVLHAVLRGDPEARGKKGLVEVVARHDTAGSAPGRPPAGGGRTRPATGAPPARR
jgi:hypothetical protein